MEKEEINNKDCEIQNLDELPEEELESNEENENHEQVYLPKKESLPKRILKGAGLAGLVVGGGALSILFYILQFLVVALAGLSSIGLAINLFVEGSIIWGLVVLFIVTPISIGLASYFFIFFFALGILTAILWGIAYIFSFDIAPANIWGGLWFLGKVLSVGGIAFFGISGFIEAIKKKEVVNFFKESWGYILLFTFMLWLFFF